MGRSVGLIAVVLAALVWSAASLAATPQQLPIAASDGTQLACSLTEPDGTPPAGGWPALIGFHGLGGKHQDLEPSALAYIVPAGYAVLACDARGHGASGGTFGLDGPRDVQDTRELFTWLAARPEISDTEIGGYGISLGGGAVWNAAAAGVPFKAIAPIITWTNLLTSLAPQGLSKSGLVQLLAQLVPQSRWDPDLLAAVPALTSSSNLASVAGLSTPRSVSTKLGALTVPTLLVQGRHDFLFDIGQALAAYRALKGPKAIYLGDLGHSPAANPAAEQETYYKEIVAWFDRYVRGVATAPKVASVVLAHDPWDGTPTSFTSLPATKTISVAMPGTTTMTGATGKVVRSVRVTGGPHETFGDSTVTVAYSGASGGWDHLVAVLTVAGNSTPITAGGVKLSAASGTATIKLMNEAVRIPAGKKLVVYLSSTSLAQDSSDALYLAAVQPSAEITIGRATLHLSVLKKAVSR